MNILVKEDLLKMQDGSHISGYLLMKDYTKQPTKNGGYFIGGTVGVVGNMQFKCWSGTDAYNNLLTGSFSSKICAVTGKVNEYVGMKSILIDSISLVQDSELRPDDFDISKYNSDKLWEGLNTLLSKNISQNAFAIWKAVMGLEDVTNCFKIEYAAINHHDNVKSGLLAHVYKVVKMTKMVLMYENIMKREKDTDLLFLGAALHDIGKIYEYTNGVISEGGKIVSHHTLGVMLLMEVKDEIIRLKDEEFFYKLCGIIEQHHGEFEERPRVLEAYIIHKIDMLDSSLQYLDQTLEGLEDTDQVKVDGYKLY